MDATSTSSACLRETYIDTDISSRFKISGFDLISYSVRNGSTLGQGAVHPDSLVAPPDSTASWKNISLYGVRIFQFRRTNKMDSVMKRLMGQCPPPQIFGLEPPLATGYMPSTDELYRVGQKKRGHSVLQKYCSDLHESLFQMTLGSSVIKRHELLPSVIWNNDSYSPDGATVVHN